MDPFPEPEKNAAQFGYDGKSQNPEHGNPGSRMLTEAEARQFADDWISAWNSHDLEAIVSHYAPEVVLTSPAAAKLLHEPSGMVVGKDALRRYFGRGLEAYPNVTFELVDVLWGISSILLYFKNQRGTMTGEFMELNADRKVTRVVANYSA